MLSTVWTETELEDVVSKLPAGNVNSNEVHNTFSIGKGSPASARTETRLKD